MAPSTPIKAQNEQELLYELAKHTYEMRKSDFVQIGSASVYNLPPRSDTAVVLDGYDFTRDEGVIRGLNLQQQLDIIKLLSERFGLPLRHNPLRVSFDAAYSPDGQTYKEKVLVPYWVFTGEMIRKLPKGYTIHRVNGVDVVTVTPNLSEDYLLVEGEVQPTKPVKIRQYKAGPALQTEVPDKTGYFTNFNNVIPVNREISEKRPANDRRIGYWNGKYFENNLSAVGCGWDSVGRGLGADAYWPLDGLDGSALGIGTDAPLNK